MLLVFVYSRFRGFIHTILFTFNFLARPRHAHTGYYYSFDADAIYLCVSSKTHLPCKCVRGTRVLLLLLLLLTGTLFSSIVGLLCTQEWIFVFQFNCICVSGWRQAQSLITCHQIRALARPFNSLKMCCENDDKRTSFVDAMKWQSYRPLQSAICAVLRLFIIIIILSINGNVFLSSDLSFFSPFVRSFFLYLFQFTFCTTQSFGISLIQLSIILYICHLCVCVCICDWKENWNVVLVVIWHPCNGMRNGKYTLYKWRINCCASVVRFHVINYDRFWRSTIFAALSWLSIVIIIIIMTVVQRSTRQSIHNPTAIIFVRRMDD